MTEIHKRIAWLAGLLTCVTIENTVIGLRELEIWGNGVSSWLVCNVSGWLCWTSSIVAYCAAHCHLPFNKDVLIEARVYNYAVIRGQSL